MGLGARPESAPETEHCTPRQPATQHQPGAGDYPGPVLRAWIELEVDARINWALRNIAGGEVGKASPSSTREEPQASPAIAAEIAETRQEVRATAQSQAGLLQVVGGLSSQLLELESGAQESQRELSSLAEAVQQLRSSLAAWRSETATELRATGMREKGESESLRLEAAASARVRDTIDRDLACLRQEMLGLTRGFDDISRYIEAWEPWLAGHLSDFERRIGAELRAALRKQQEAILSTDDPLWRTEAKLRKELGRPELGRPPRASSARRSTALRS